MICGYSDNKFLSILKCGDLYQFGDKILQAEYEYLMSVSN